MGKGGRDRDEIIGRLRAKLDRDARRYLLAAAGPVRQRTSVRSGYMRSIMTATDTAVIPQHIETKSRASPFSRADAASAQQWTFERLSGCPICHSAEASTML